MTIEEVLSLFDKVEKKGFTTYDIVGKLSELNENEKKKNEFQYEILAFQLQPSNNENTPWNTYYGPQLTFTDQNGNLVYRPPFDSITIEAIHYWERRYKIVNNPLLVMRYAGLVWDFKRIVAHEKYDSDLYRKYVDSMLKVCNEDYAQHPVLTTNILERLFVLVNGNLDDLRLLKTAYKEFEKRHAKDDAVRYWASQFLMMLKYRKCFEQSEIDDLVNQHEQRLLRLSTPDADGNVNPWNVQQQAELLADYYNSKQNKDEIRRVLKKVEESFAHESDKITKMQLMGNYELLYQKYRHYSLDDEAKRISAEIQKIGKDAKNELQTQSIEFSIPKEVYEQAQFMFGEQAQSDEERWMNFIVYFIPRKENEEICLKDLVAKYPLKFLCSTNLMDVKGRPMSVVGPYDNDPEGHLILHIAEKMQLNAYFLDYAIKAMVQIGALTTEKIMNNFIKESPLFEDNRYGIIEKALDAFFQQEYTIMCHLLVPQIENAICNLVELSGTTVLKSQRKGNGFQLKTLDELLGEKIVKDVFTENGAYYLRLVLSEQRGLNIRNLLCHGLVPPDNFNVVVAERLIHVLLMLGSVKYNS